MRIPWWAWLALGVAVMSGGSNIIAAELPQARKLKRRSSTSRLVYHTTGRNLPRTILSRTGLEPGTRAFDDAVVNWYRSTGQPYFGNYLVGTSGAVYELATPDTWCQHAASLTAEEVASAPPAWWKTRWPHLRHPTDLLNGSPHINATSLGIDLVPHPGLELPDIHLPATLTAAAALGRSLASTYGLTVGPHHHLGHEDVDPWSRSTPGKPWDPGWRRDAFLKELAG